ncbi:MAG: hypothetical protein R3B96_17980 [Pirellulaceae bacterium]
MFLAAVALVAYDEYALASWPSSPAGPAIPVASRDAGPEYWLWDWTHDQFTSGEEEPVEGN